MKRILAIAAVVLIGAVAFALVPYERGLAAFGRDGNEVDVGLSVACPAPVIGAFEDGGAGWFNYASNEGASVTGAGLCRSSARWRLAGAVVLGMVGGAVLRRGLHDRGEPTVTDEA